MADVRAATKEEIPQLADTLASAFNEDPVFEWMEESVPFYRRHRFEVREEVKLKNGPSLCPMMREPR
jgi:hypothetical protein